MSKQRSNRTVLGILVALAAPVSAMAQTHDADTPEEIIVSAPFMRSQADTALPVGVLGGEDLRERVSNSLGETLKNEIGIANASFGTGVGQPVIRGQSGNRVSVLSNGVGVTDASKVSPDHANAVEAVLADRIEVVRGPATLLYGSGAVGGIVNVIDGRIPERIEEEPNVILQQTHNSVNDEDATVVGLTAGSGIFGFHLDAFSRDSGDVSVPGLAIDTAGVKALDELLLGEAHARNVAGDHEEDMENSAGYIGNSNADGQGGAIGVSLVGERGFVGFSVSKTENNYGLPPGAHSHDHGGDHEDPAAEPLPVDQHDHGEVDAIRIAMEKTRYDLKGSLDLDDSWFETLTASIGYTDYQHQELEFFADGDQDLGSLFTNQGVETRLTASHAHAENRSGVWGLQMSDTEFAALGEEAFIPRSDIKNLGLFGVERVDLGDWTAELGVRMERNKVEPGTSCGFSDTTYSISGSAIYSLDDSSNVLFGLTRSQRTPTVEELYSNIDQQTCARVADDENLVLHAATALLEVGNPDLGSETSRNLELGYRKFAGVITGQLSAYYNEIDAFIYLDLLGEVHEGQAIAGYLARDARFYGLEGEAEVTLHDAVNSSLILRVFGDKVKADFRNGGAVPRIPAAKLGADLNLEADNWSTRLQLVRVADQERVGPYELGTDGYVNLSLYADYHVAMGQASELQLFLRADNLLDEEIRNHVSLLKLYAPEPGRALTVGLRFSY